MGKTRNTILHCTALSISLLGSTVCVADENNPPPFAISEKSQQLASDYLVCATDAFEKKYTGTINLDEAVNYSLGQCTAVRKHAYDSILQDAVQAGCESCAQEVMTEMDKEVRRKLIGEIDYEEKAERSLGL